ncbi:MAG: DUF4960 domain-containing protein [Muribaculaceae bacterium]|nr:DUF4960 domain-containing protein [Muribaculaceae bacterium]
MNTKLSYIATLLIALTLACASCNKDNTSDLRLSGKTFINTLTLDSYEATIDNLAKTVTVGVPVDYDISAMTLTAISLPDGATADMKVGEVIDCTVPRNITVVNGDVHTNYTMTVSRDNAYFTSFVLDNKYQGSIDNVARTIKVFVPIDAKVESMLATFAVNYGTTVTPESGSMVDFTNPVVFTATYRTAVIEYTVTVIKDDMSQEPKAFVGNAEYVENLGAEARAAAQWMLENVPNSTYIWLQDILNGTVKLSDYKMLWCHFDFTDWPGVMWDTRDIFNDYYIKGGNILASRDGARYINDVWRIALDQQCPNNMFGGDSAETLAEDLGFSIAGHEDHPIYANLPVVENRILMVSAGCTNTNRTLQWGVDWDPYGSMSGWEQKTGARSIAADHGGDINRCTIAEFVPREVLKGYQSGIVITVGTPAYEWHQANGVNAYRPNIEQFTRNAINYLCK